MKSKIFRILICTICIIGLSVLIYKIKAEGTNAEGNKIYDAQKTVDNGQNNMEEFLNFDKLKLNDEICNITKRNTLYFSSDMPIQWYCVQRSQAMRYARFMTYKITGVYNIFGKTITDENGNEIQVSDNNKNVIAMLAYILQKNLGHGGDTINPNDKYVSDMNDEELDDLKHPSATTSTQELVWHHFNEIAAAIGKGNEWSDTKNPIVNINDILDNLDKVEGVLHAGSNSQLHAKEYIIDGIENIRNTEIEARNYANNLPNNLNEEKPIIKNEISSPVVSQEGEYIEFGPLNVIYPSTIKDIEVMDQNNTKLNEYSFFRYIGNNKVFINPLEISSGSDFYVRFKVDNTVVNMNKIKLKIDIENVKIYCARLVIAENRSCADSHQNLMLAKNFSKEIEGDILDWDINIRGQLKIVKKDLDMIPGVKFAIKKGNKFILKNIKTNEMMEFDEGTWYNCIDTGEWQINSETGANQYGWTNLFTYEEIAGYRNNSDYKYVVYKGTDYVLRQTESKKTTFFDQKRFRTEHSEEEWENKYNWSKVYTSEQLDLLYRRLPNANFTVKYKKADGTEEFVIRNINNANESLIYMGVQDWYSFGVGDGVNVYGYTNVFTSDENGEINIDDIAIGTYEVKEISNNNPGFLTYPNQSNIITVRPKKETLSYVEFTNHQIIDIKIRKVDENTKVPLSNVGFKLQNTIIGESGWVRIENGNVTYTDFNNATELFTNQSGECTFEKVLTGYYAVYETKNPNPYYDQYVNKIVKDGIIAYDANNGIDRRVTIDVEATNPKNSIDLKVIKEDADTKARLSGVKFTITAPNTNIDVNRPERNKKNYIIVYTRQGQELDPYDGELTVGQIKYIGEDDWKEQNLYEKEIELNGRKYTVKMNYYGWTETFETDENGEALINKVSFGEHTITETYNPQNGYEKYPNKTFELNISKDNKDSIYESSDNKQYVFTYEMLNKREYVNLSGYVWKEAVYALKEGNIRDELYTNDVHQIEGRTIRDTGFNGIKVRIKNNNNEVLTDRDGNEIKECITSEMGKYDEIDGGEYGFNQVRISDLSNCYIEFEYDGLIWQSVIPNISKTNGSKAIDDSERNTLDKKFDNISFGSTLQDEKQTVKFNNGQNTIQYNKTTDHRTSISDSSQCVLHANTKETKYIINYSDNDYAAGTTELKYINLGLYEKPQADLALAQDLQNIKMTINGYEHLYNGQARMTNGEFNTEKANQYDAWNVGVKFKDEYTNTYSRTVYEADAKWENKNDKSKELQVYFTYKIAVKNESTYLTKINSIVDYYDSNYEVVAVGTGLGDKNEITGVLKSKQEVYNDDYKKLTVTANKNIKAGEQQVIYVQFKVNRELILKMLNGEEDNLLYNTAEINSYTVYKDENQNTVAAVDNDSVPGNAVLKKIDTYEDDIDAAPPVSIVATNPRTITGLVFVDEAESKGTGNVRQGNGIFDKNEKTISNVKVELKEINGSTNEYQYKKVETKEDGTYEISDFIPGQYQITYTWGNKEYIVQDYKGTVYNSKRKQDNMYWYKDNVDTRETDAIDNYNTRKEIDKQISKITNLTESTIKAAYEDGYNGNIINKMNSDTPVMEFGIEYDTVITDSVNDKLQFNVKNVDFGVIERAKQELAMVKRVKTFKITLSNGQVLADVTVNSKVGQNGKELREITGTTNHVTYMGPKAGTNGFIKAEVDQELIEGATLEVGYEISFENKSEVDYMTEEFYKYGTNRDENKIVTLRPSKVIDYLDKNLSNVSDTSKWQQIDKIEFNGLNAQNKYEESKLVIKTESIKEIKPGEKTAIDFNVSKLLSSSGDINFDNKSEDVEISKQNIEEHRGRRVEVLPQADSERVEVTPSTGENKDYKTIIIVSITSLIVLAGGIILIKKKIL